MPSSLSVEKLFSIFLHMKGIEPTGNILFLIQDLIYYHSSMATEPNIRIHFFHYQVKLLTVVMY